MRALLRPNLLLRAALSLAAAPLRRAAAGCRTAPGATALPTPPHRAGATVGRAAGTRRLRRGQAQRGTGRHAQAHRWQELRRRPAACRRQAAALDDALRTAPVSLALWYASYRCAEAGGDAAQADHDLQAFHALVKHAFDTAAGQRPHALRVLAERDVDAFVRASGQTLLFAFYDPGRGDPRRLPLVLSLWDDETQNERLLGFDFFDSLMHLNRNQRFAEFPLFRRGVPKLLENMASRPDRPRSPAGRLQQARCSRTDAAARIDALKTAAAQGNYGAALALGGACFNAPALACAGDAVDAPLPGRNSTTRRPSPCWRLAYERGRGTAQVCSPPRPRCRGGSASGQGTAAR